MSILHLFFFFFPLHFPFFIIRSLIHARGRAATPRGDPMRPRLPRPRHPLLVRPHARRTQRPRWLALGGPATSGVSRRPRAAHPGSPADPDGPSGFRATTPTAPERRPRPPRAASVSPQLPARPCLRTHLDGRARVLVLTLRANSPRAHASDREPREA